MRGPSFLALRYSLFSRAILHVSWQALAPTR